MRVSRLKILVAAALASSLIYSSAAFAADSATQDGKDQAAIDKLVANQPGTTSTQGAQAQIDKPMTINFSDFVKDGAGCGMPNLDTSSK